jgi:hypothetical protein
MNIILWESTIFQWKKPLTILVIPTLRLEFPNEIATSTKAVDPYLSQSASNFLAIFVGFMGWPIHHFQAPGELTRSFTSGGGAEARSARPGAEGFGISVEPWKVRIRHQPQWVWNFCTQTGKLGFGEQFLECHAYCMDSMLNSEVEALKEEVLGALELFSFRFTNWENHLDHLPRGFTPSEPTAFRSQGTARAGATTSWGWEARWCRGIVTLGAEHDTNYLQFLAIKKC